VNTLTALGSAHEARQAVLRYMGVAHIVGALLASDANRAPNPVREVINNRRESLKMKRLRSSFAPLAVAASVISLSATLASAAPPIPSSAPVTVTNTSSNPVPITGSTTVSGSVAASQSGPWNVEITGSLPALSMQGTTVINDMVVPAGSIDQGFFFDASSYKEIRIVGIVVRGSLGSCPFTVTVWLTDPNNAYAALMRLDQYATSTTLDTTKVYDVVATNMAYTAKTSCDTRLIAYGRTN
jgi:hypothetical protein